MDGSTRDLAHAMAGRSTGAIASMRATCANVVPAFALMLVAGCFSAEPPRSERTDSDGIAFTLTLGVPADTAMREEAP